MTSSTWPSWRARRSSRRSATVKAARGARTSARPGSAEPSPRTSTFPTQSCRPKISTPDNFSPTTPTKSATSPSTGSRSTTTRCSPRPRASSYWLRGFLLALDGLWGSGYRRGFANSGELPPSLQFNLAVVHNFRMPGVGRMQGRVAILNLFDHSYLIRNGTGIGVFSPQYGPRRAVYAGITVPLGAPARQSTP